MVLNLNDCSGNLQFPRLLHCLHGFCEECLDKKLVSEAGDCGTQNNSISCPICGHLTRVSS